MTDALLSYVLYMNNTLKLISEAYNCHSTDWTACNLTYDYTYNSVHQKQLQHCKHLTNPWIRQKQAIGDKPGS